MDELAGAVGTSKQTIHRYENGTISNIPAERVEAIADALGTVPSVLLGWNDSISTEFPIFDTETLSVTDNVISIPSSDMCVVADDDSMSGDRILASDILLISKSARVESSDIALIAVKGRRALIRRVLFSGNNVVLHASNPKHEPLVYNKYEVEIKGKVIALISRIV